MTTKTWFITGCDKGLGRAVATAALERGDRVLMTVLDPGTVADLLAAHDGQARAFELDLRHLDGVPPTVQAAESTFGAIDVLVNNAGYAVIGPVEETDPQLYRPMFDVDFFAVAEITRAVLPGMRRRHSGSILNVSSVAGFDPRAGLAFYSAAKFAVEGFSESLAREVRPLGIRVTIVEPGGMRTDFAGPSLVPTGTFSEDYASTSGAVQEMLRQESGRQWGDPKRFAQAMLRLADSADPPGRIALGGDALKRMRSKLAHMAEEADAWEELSRSVAFPPEERERLG